MTTVAPTTQPASEMYDEDDARGWLMKGNMTRNQAKLWAVGEFGCDYIEVRCKTVWLRGLTVAEQAYSDWGGIGCDKNSPGAVAFWEVSA